MSLALALGASFLLLLAGCGGGTLDREQLEQDIAVEIAGSQEEGRIGAERVDVSCPDDIEAEAGNEFDCEMTSEMLSTDLTIDVVLTDDEGNFEATIDQG